MLEQPAFGNRLRALRIERGLSQAALAEGGLSTGYLSRLESGARSPTRRVVDHLSKRLGVPTSAFDLAQVLPSLSEALASVTSAAEAASHDDLVEILTQALHTDDNRNPILRWQALWLLSRLHGDRGQHNEEQALLLELAGISDRLGLPELTARAQVRLSRCVQALGDHVRAREYAAEAYRLSAGLSLADRSEALYALIWAEVETGRLTEARTHATELCELAEPADGILHIRALWATATVCIRQADYTVAQQFVERALPKLDSRMDLTLWTSLRLTAASLYLQVTPPLTQQARILLDQVAPVLDLVGTEPHQQQQQQLLMLQAQLAFADGRIQDVRALCERIEEQPRRLSFRDHVRLNALRNRLLIFDGHFDEGTRALQQLAEEAQGAPDVELAAEIWRDLAETLTRAFGKEKKGRRAG